MCKFNHCSDRVVRLKSFPGAASKELAHYVVPSLKEESFHTVLIHVGINDILRDQNELILQNIMKIAHHCKEHEVKEITLSSVVATGRVNADVLIHFYKSLKNLCRENGFCFVNKDNISEGNLCKDKLHLLEAGKHIRADNFINDINNYFLFKHRQNNHF